MAQAPSPARRVADAVDGSALAERYGRRRTSPRAWWVLAAVCGAVLLGALAWIATSFFAPSVHHQDVGFHVIDETAVQVTYDVTKPAERSAVCTLEALSTGFGQVGLLEVEIGPQERHTVRITSVVATSEEATTGIVRACHLVD